MISILHQHQLVELACTSHGGSLATNSIQDALQFCKRLTKSHYENFPVASFLIPAPLRDHVLVIYTFSRIADDIADEYSLEHGSEKADHALSLMHHFASVCHNGEYQGTNPLWMSLSYLFHQTALPLEPFERLLTAFMSDVHFQPMRTMDDVLTYCTNSANPIGELLLRLYANWDSSTKISSNALCTALQMTNFLQDMSLDRLKNRCYIPPKDTFLYKDVENYLANGEITPNFSSSLTQFVHATIQQFKTSKNLLKTVTSFRLRCELLLIYLSGTMMLKKVIASIEVIPYQRQQLVVSDYVKLGFKFFIFLPTIVFRH